MISPSLTASSQEPRAAFCVPCRERGHACAAQNGIDQCVFCEDGEPCPVTAAAARKAATAPTPAIGVRVTFHRPALEVKEKTERVSAKSEPDREDAARGRSSAALRRPSKKDAASAARSHLEQNGAQRENPAAQAVVVSTWLKQRDAYRDKRKAARAEKQKEKAMDGIKCKRADCQTLTKTDHGYCPKHFYLSIAKDPALVGRKCSTGCGGKIRADNKSGICKSCVKAGVKKPSSDQSSSAKQKSQPQPPKPNGSATAVTSGGEAVATICVTEGALNQWWGKQSIQSKADLFSLAMAEDQELAASSK